LVSDIGIGTRLHAGRSGVRILVGTSGFSLLQKVQTVPRNFLLSVYWGSLTEINRSDREVIFLSVEPSLSISRAIPFYALWRAQRKI